MQLCLKIKISHKQPLGLSIQLAHALGRLLIRVLLIDRESAKVPDYP